jgi:hypothetical protein
LPREKCRFGDLEGGQSFLYKVDVWIKSGTTSAEGIKMGVDSPVSNGKTLEISVGTEIETY